MHPAVHALGDSAITISLAEIPSRAGTERARVVAAGIREARLPHIEEVIAAYTSVTVFYDALHVSFEQLSAGILAIIQNGGATPHVASGTSHRHTIPVTYDGPDLDFVATSTKLTRDQVIEIHSSTTYTVDLLGFVPGFAYLSELDPRLVLPRREQPRPRVPAGSVAIAAGLTGIYPFETPGGWHILGKTEIVMFDPRRAEPSLFKPGDTVKFEPRQ